MSDDDDDGPPALEILTDGGDDAPPALEIDADDAPPALEIVKGPPPERAARLLRPDHITDMLSAACEDPDTDGFVNPAVFDHIDSVEAQRQGHCIAQLVRPPHPLQFYGATCSAVVAGAA